MSGSLGNALSIFRRAIQPAEESRALSRLDKDTSIQAQMEQFRRAVDGARDIKAALRDRRVLTVIGTAMGIPEAPDRAGLASRALLSDLKDEKSVANTLSDKRWKEAAESLNLGKQGLGALRDPKVQATLLEGLKQARWRDDLDAQNKGMADALEFNERAGRAETSLDVLGDPVLRRVVTGALGLPQQIAIQSVEAQARAVDSRFKVAKLQNPAEVRRMAERYLIATASAESSSESNVLARYGFNV